MYQRFNLNFLDDFTHNKLVKIKRNQKIIYFSLTHKQQLRLLLQIDNK